MRQQHQHINTQTPKDAFIPNEQVVINHSETVRIQQVPVIHSKSSPTIPLTSDCQPNKLENINKNIRELPGLANNIDNSHINSIHRSTSMHCIFIYFNIILNYSFTS